MKKAEFKEYLALFFAKKTVDNIVCYCNTAEAVLGRDLEDIVHDFNEIQNAETQLASSPSTVRNAFRYYIGFTYSPKVKAKHSATADVTTSAVFSTARLVEYYADVPAEDRDETLRKALEDCYPLVLRYAADILGASVSNGLRYIPVYLSRETPAQTYPVNKAYLEKLKKKYAEEKPLNDIVRPLLETESIHNKVTGRFFGGKEPYIEIYYKNLRPVETTEWAMNCLAHEYMHFLHYYYVTNANQGAWDPFCDKKLSEAIADFFAQLYSNRAVHLLLAEVRYAEWQILRGSGWPYAYAIFFLPKRRRRDWSDYTPNALDEAIDKFRSVFRMSTDPKAALKALKA